MEWSSIRNLCLDDVRFAFREACVAPTALAIISRIDTHGFRRGLALFRAYGAGLGSVGFSLRQRKNASRASMLGSIAKSFL
jgi:hypothetical protein